jgi:hypothetical protein
MSEPNSIVFLAPGRAAELMRCLVVRTISLQTVYECKLDPAIGKRRVWQCVSFLRSACETGMVYPPAYQHRTIPEFG